MNTNGTDRVIDLENFVNKFNTKYNNEACNNTNDG